ncbi:START domain-containing protein [Alcanivorax sp. S6407]|uniref:START domain-containing protein n=1 Tax=Alcanivorax sp. S6407 TaxID=2926424 RepID=UPI001FF57284|nr:START domain-containing protein [Alcanivorax sp. S6407]MCK0153128.1 START domain-containing protein [Alcanivorax sp. S6407]
MKIILTLIMMLALTMVSHADAPEQEPVWILVTDRDGVKVYRQKESDTRLKTFRGIARMPVDDFKAIGVLMDDYDAVADFMHMVSEIRDVKRYSHYKRDVYITTRLPWPVSDRDAPLRVSFYQEPDSYDLVMPIALNPGMPEQKGYVRMPQMEGYYRFSPVAPGEVEVTIEVILDPGGAVPAWIANIILRDIPYFSLKRLRRVINQPRFQGVDTGYYQVPESWKKGDDASVANASAGNPAP